ncbi:MAG: FtsQ-type POTRA domain-containing protein [Candidatus Aureabacteria bacterium]|nr:FtsQ-type POTRA domain-containing protein [Candidatus Auribacterota bacterium]
MNDKKRKHIFFPFVRGSSCGRKPYKKTFQARMSRRKTSGSTGFFKRFFKVVISSLKILGFCAVLLGAFIFAEDIYKNFINMEDFLIKDISIKGNYFVKEEDILKKAHISFHDNLFQIDMNEMADRIRKIPVIKTVVLKKSFPGTLMITVSERDPVFISGERKYLLDEEGIRLPFESENFNVPEIYGFSYNTMGHIREEHREMLRKTVEAVRRFYETRGEIPLGVQSVHVKEDRYLLLTLSDETRIKLPFSFEDKHFERLVLVYNDLSQKEVPFESIDLTFKHVVVKKKKESQKM